MIDEKLHSTAFRIWRSFQSWGLNPHKKNLIPDSERSKLDNNYRATVETYDDNNDFYEINIHLLARKDPIYSMILIDYQQISTRFFSSFQSVAKHLSRLTPSNLNKKRFYIRR